MSSWGSKEEVERRFKRRSPAVRRLSKAAIIASQVAVGEGLRFQSAVSGKFLKDNVAYTQTIEMDISMTVTVLEDGKNLIEELAEDVRNSKETLQQLANEVRALADIVLPQLRAQTDHIRAARMTAVTEVNQALSAMREIRKFFLEADHVSEIERLEKFVSLCKQMGELKNTGVIDAVCDTVLRLAVAEPSR